MLKLYLISSSISGPKHLWQKYQDISYNMVQSFPNKMCQYIDSEAS